MRGHILALVHSRSARSASRLAMTQFASQRSRSRCLRSDINLSNSAHDRFRPGAVYRAGHLSSSVSVWSELCR